MSVRVLVVALESHRQTQMANDLGRVVRAGGDGLLITRSLDSWPRLASQIVTMETERWHGEPPASPMALLPTSLRRVTGTRAGARRSVGWQSAVIEAPGGHLLHPYIDWLVVKRVYLVAIDVPLLTHVVTTTPAAWPIAWHLARLNAGIEITSGFDHRALQPTTRSSAG